MPDRKPHVLNVPDKTGHSTKEWLPGQKLAVAEAEAVFREKRAGGYAAFDMTDKESPALIFDFDPNAEEITLIAPLAGG